MFDEVLFAKKDHLGLVTLNRPAALNALTLPMIQAMQQQLSEWEQDPSIHAVVLMAAPGKAFCAGGDIRMLYHAGNTHIPEKMQFFWHEYRLNHFIQKMSKPYISLIDGMVMGGGVGVSLHGSHPIASERLVFAMPETAIGFFPDIGASYLLNRCPGALGIYLALSGNRLGPQEAKTAGLVKQIVASERMPDLLETLSRADLSTNAHAQVDACIKEFQSATEAAHAAPLIDTCFAQPSMEMIYEALNGVESDWGSSIKQLLEKKSPTSLKVTLEQLHRTKNLSLAQCLTIDYILAEQFMKGHDFYEGVRALLIDKDQSPQWVPARLELVSDVMVLGYFEQVGVALEL
ncbi:MAG: enoyl-CoA hydratase/isomerase family protein [Legionella sp.]|jgi:enoyl-CoA hydratase/carnithine racemase